MNRRFACLFILIVMVIGSIRWIVNQRERKTEGVFLSSFYEFESQEDGKQVPVKILNLLNQEFAYLGKGAQVYAFASKDGKFVLKLFKGKHLRTDRFMDRLIPSAKKKRAEKKDRLFKSIALADQELKMETGILYARLTPDISCDFTVTLIRKDGLRIDCDLSRTPFVIQKRGVPYYVYVSRKVLNGEEAEAKRVLDQIIGLKKRLAKKKIHDQDGAFGQNYGIDKEGFPFLLDAGFLKKNHEISSLELFHKELEKMVLEEPNQAYEEKYPGALKFYRLNIFPLSNRFPELGATL